MIQFLEDLQGKGTPPLSAEERSELEHLRKEHQKVRWKVQAQKHKEDSDGSDDSEDEVGDWI